MLFEAPTIAQLAKRIENLRREEQGLLPPPITRVSREDALPLSYAQGVRNAQPAHIHAGTCNKLGAIAYALPTIVVGKSTTVVPVSLDALLKGTYAINVHRSAKKLNEYVACGNITENAAPTPTVTTSEQGSG